MAAGKVWLVGAGPGDIGLFTLKGAAVLQQADVVVYDSLVGEGVLAKIPEHARLINVGKRANHHTMVQEDINKVLLEEAQKGNKVLTDVNELKFKDGRNIGVNYMPDADSPVLTAASFNDALLSSGFETVEYIGAFGTDDNWLDSWTNFDPNNTDY